MKSTKLLTSAEYITDLTRRIGLAKRRINMMALVIAEDDSTRAMIDALCAASERGIVVTIGMDIYFTYKEIGEASSRFDAFRKQTQAMRATKRRLERSGVKVRWLGQYGISIISRRTHTKWSVVDDVVYSFGGVNLFDEGINSVDYMFRIRSKQLAERIAAEHDFILLTDKAARGYPSHSIPFTKQDTILIDGGNFFDSIIYRRAVALAKQAKQITYVSQYCPTGKLARTLKPRRTIYYFNTPKNVTDFLNRSAIRFAIFRTGIRSRYKKKQYLHAKCMIFTMADGEKVALTGSHNFVELGAMAGTREVALETKDQKIISQLETFIATAIVG